MIRALKVVMVVYGVIGVLLGLAFIFVPRQMGIMMGYEEGPKYLPYFLALLGGSFVSASLFLIAAVRDPILHISWVKFAVLLSALSSLLGIYSIIVNYASFSQAGPGVVIDGIFAILFLAFYPWRLAASRS